MRDYSEDITRLWGAFQSVFHQTSHVCGTCSLYLTLDFSFNPTYIFKLVSFLCLFFCYILIHTWYRYRHTSLVLTWSDLHGLVKHMDSDTIFILVTLPHTVHLKRGNQDAIKMWTLSLKLRGLLHKALRNSIFMLSPTDSEIISIVLNIWAITLFN